MRTLAKRTKRTDSREEVLEGEVVEATNDILVSGDVAGTILATSGRVRVIVAGDVRPSGVIVASGGSAKIVVAGDIYYGAQLHAQGGNARVVVAGDMIMPRP